MLGHHGRMIASQVDDPPFGGGMGRGPPSADSATWSTDAQASCAMIGACAIAVRPRQNGRADLLVDHSRDELEPRTTSRSDADQYA
jgi:hypothetical protein